MAFTLAFLGLLAVHIIPMRVLQGNVLTSLIKLWLALSFLKTVPYTLLSFWFPGVVDPRITSAIGASWLPATITQFCVLYTVFLCCVLAPILFRMKESSHFVLNFREDGSVLQLVRGNFLPKLGLLAILLLVAKIYVIGGVGATILGDELDRTGVLAGNNYIVGFADTVLVVTVLAAQMSYAASRNPAVGIAFLLLATLAMVSLTLFGGRKAFLYLLLQLAFFWSVYVREIRIVSLRGFSLVAIAVVFFISILDLRLGNEHFGVAYARWDFGPLSPFVTFVANLSYNDTYYFLLSYFSDAPVYFGRTFLDLVFAPIPSGLYPEKPPTDEGLYVKSLVLGTPVPIPTPYRDMAPGSLPVETFGNAIQNFGVWGIPLAGAALGMVLVEIHRLFEANRYSVVWNYLLLFTAMNFQFSNLRITNMLAIGFFLLLVNFFVLNESLPSRPLRPKRRAM